MYIPVIIHVRLNRSHCFMYTSVKHSYNEHAYKWIDTKGEVLSFPMTLLHIVNFYLMDIMNYVYGKAKLAIPGTSL